MYRVYFTAYQSFLEASGPLNDAERGLWVTF